MSGGHWDYKNDQLAYEIFGWNTQTDCGLTGKEHDVQQKLAMKSNPLSDPELSALVFDVFCLLHSYDWARSGDTDMEDFRKDAQDFRNRWLGTTREAQVRVIVESCVEQLKDDLYAALLPHEEKQK